MTIIRLDNSIATDFVSIAITMIIMMIIIIMIMCDEKPVVAAVRIF